MTTPVDIVNLALQSFGSRTTITAAQLATNSNNEAKQANLTYANTRDTLLRMAPWNCGMKTANLVYITSVPGTPENTSPPTNLWQPGQPRPPWAYEYQYPVDCLRPCWMIPSTQFGFSGGVPITTAITGGASTLWNGAPISFKVGIDSFFSLLAWGISAGGTGYTIGDIIQTAPAPAGSPPFGAPAQARVTLLGALNTVSAVEVVSNILGANPPSSGSYLTSNSIGIATVTATGAGVGAVLTPAGIIGPIDQRVILTNQEFATLVYVRQVTDPNIWDPIFQDAMVNSLGADICIALTGDKTLANMCIARANHSIEEARKADGNEGLTINDVTPDWIRARGVWWTDNLQSGPYGGFDWGGLLPSY